MKRNIKNRNISSLSLRMVTMVLLAVTTAMFTSCSDWLDVTPKTQIKSDSNFSKEQGFKDALTGVYLLMTDKSLYGQELTYGMLDAMGQYYTGLSASNTYQYDAAFDYDNSDCETRINAIWSKMFTAIANDNELIKQIDNAKESLFTGRNYHLIRGEAYALRAFMHFDLARLWGESYAANGKKLCIPYVTNVSADVTALNSVEDVMRKALDDLSVAEKELLVDPVVDQSVKEGYDTSYERDRTFKMNYYAVRLLRARIYLYMGDYRNAQLCANDVINQNKFYWTPEVEITTSQTARRNMVFSEELVFCLYDTDLRSRYSSLFTGSVSSLCMNERTYQAVYELYNAGYSGDYRYAYQNTELNGAHYSTKLSQPTSGDLNYMFRIPLMRLSEAYYIAAECALEFDGDIAKASDLLCVVRSHRNLTDPLPSNLSADEMRNEIRKEYVKEFMCEGQLYYYYKRLNYTAIPIYTADGDAVSVSYVTPHYTFPLPDDEVEYGRRDDETK